jgi:hypothetical protein
MMPRWRAALLVVAFGSLAPRVAEGQRVIVTLRAHPTPIVMDTIGHPVEVNAPFQRVYLAAVLAFEGLKIPLETRDSVAGRVGNLNLTQSRRLAGSNLSRFLDCGSTMTGLRADSYRIEMPLIVLLDRAGQAKTRVRVGLVASARDMSGTSTEPVLCLSTGVLEARIHESIGRHVAASGS